LVFGAWNFLFSKTKLFLDMLFDFFNVFVGNYTNWGENKKAEPSRPCPAE
jgi:hypothetical protein